MSQYRKIVNTSIGQTIAARAKYCASFYCSFRGLMFSGSPNDVESIIFERPLESRLLAAMHTMGMRYSIGIVWLDRELSVVEMRVAPPRRIACVPYRAAKYVIETAPESLSRVAIGDRFAFDEVIN